ncbi:MAG TPA: HAMP domain-containing sensor histidine kinase [Pelobium sp.]|nr:HAMP domain-containing sensor histidine kinase [Pelobium sp.]
MALVITGVLLHSLLAANYFVNGGIAGPTAILFLAVVFLMISVVSLKNSWIWLSLNLGLIAGLFLVEYLYSDSIIITGYSDKFHVFADVYSTYIMLVFLMSIGIFYKRRAYEEQRKALEKKALALEKLNVEKNKLFSIISHDLRTPVGSVKQYLSFLKDHNLTEYEKTTIEEGLIKSTNEAYELLDNLLVWAKSQLGGSKPFIAKLNPAKTLASTLQNAKDYAEKKNICLTYNMENIDFLGDENLLQIVIRNLLFNAIKFSEVNGDIMFNVYTENNQAVFMVQDNGVGISEDNQKKIFSLDVKSSIGTKKEKGTGLGLVLCKEYMHLQNGTISFTSQLNQGSTFFVSLPVSN